MKVFHASLASAQVLVTMAAATCLACPSLAQIAPRYTSRVIAGDPTKGGPAPVATSIPLSAPGEMAEDVAGNVYISERNGGVIRVVSPEGTMRLFAGTGARFDAATLRAVTPEGTLAAETHIGTPAALLIDRDGGLIYSDHLACRIRKVGTNGRVTTLVGTGECGFNGDGRPGPQTQIRPAVAVIRNPDGLITFSDSDNGRVRVVGADGIVSTIAGNGATAGREDRPALSEGLRFPQGLAYDLQRNLYIAEWGTCRIRRISGGTVRTFAGIATPGPEVPPRCASPTEFADGTRLDVALGNMYQLAFDSDTNSLVAGSPGLRRFLRISIGAPARISTIAGSGAPFSADTPDPLARSITSPVGILISARHGLLLSDMSAWQTYRLRDARLSRFAGTWPQLDRYPPAQRTILMGAAGLASLPGGALLIADKGANRILRYDPPDRLTAVIGRIGPQCCTMAAGVPPLDNTPAAPDRLAVSGSTIYFRESLAPANAVRLVQLDGGVTRFFNVVTPALWETAAVSVDRQGSIFSTTGHTIRRWDPATLQSTLFAGQSLFGFSGDGGPATEARMFFPGVTAHDSKGNRYVADYLNLRIRRIGSDGVITTVAGNGEIKPGDYRGQPIGQVPMSGLVSDLAVDSFDNLIWTDGVSIFGAGPDRRLRVLTGFTGAPGEFVGKSYLGIHSLAAGENGRIYFSVSFGLAPELGSHVVELTPVLPGSIVAVSGGEQVLYTGTTGADLAARVLYEDGTPAVAVPVTFVVTRGSAVLGAESAATGADGVATVPITGGPGAGPITVTASTFGLSTAFELRLEQPAPELESVAAPARFGAAPAVAPGGLLELRGKFLADRQANAQPAEPGFAGVRVTVGGQEARIRRVSPNMVEAIVPGGLEGSVPVSLERNGVAADREPVVEVAARAPVLMAGDVAGFAAGRFAADTDFRLAPYDSLGRQLVRPASTGESVVLQATGLGAEPNDVRIVLGGQRLPATLVGTEDGLDEVQFTVPAGVSGDTGVAIEVGGTTGPARDLLLSVGPGVGRVVAESGFEPPVFAPGESVVGRGGWLSASANPAPGSMVAQSAVKRSGELALRLQIPTDVRGQTGVLRRPGDVANRKVALSAYLYRSSDAPTFDFICADRTAIAGYLRWRETGALELAADSTRPLGVTLAAGAWHRVTLVFDMEAKTVTAYANGIRGGETAPFAAGAGSIFNAIWFNVPAPGPGLIAVDDVRVQVLP